MVNHMKSNENSGNTRIRILTYLMFFMFAMTSDAVGVIIPELINTFDLSMSQASAFHYMPMLFIALSGLFLGFLADKLGRKITILIGLLLFALASFMFALGESFYYFLCLLALVGIAIGVFKTGALGLIGDISTNSKQHSSTMNTVEGFFGVGAMVGPAIVSYLLITGVSWKYLYFGAGVFCLILCWLAYKAEYPQLKRSSTQDINLASTFSMMRNPYALGYSLAIGLYVATEVAIYVWMPTLLLNYEGELALIATYALTIFFTLRALGRFLGGWILNRYSWQQVMFWFSLAISLCYLGAMMYGISAAVILLPLSGLFMSMMYPTLNSKGISCFPVDQHGSVAGVILFFTALSAALGPLLMGVVGDIFGHVKYGFYLATGFAFMLCLLAAYNLLRDPSGHLLTADAK
ncbi:MULTISPECIES: MFS transporter [unclassified Shewanella]|jgi:DHA1 family quinolone resistance protein-like MFS transporter|uniref:MFS transporter n=1 Tax=unclassified Shewanella TaxID=196818 RepID=UPI000C348349|nr:MULTISPECIES: MFS transporter [unclassified Shewanella]MBO1897821.1 MFS transporter [Shewanella sp. BF02_Schw]PKH28496.1 MFS transporter [Shewanella sp. ALD9]